VGIRRRKAGPDWEAARMPSYRLDSNHWRDRAAQMRLLAAEMTDKEAAAVMLKLADEYNNLADRAETRVKDRADRAKSKKASPDDQQPGA